MASIGDNAFQGCNLLTSVTIDKDKETVQGMANYNWGLPIGCTIHCSDGDIYKTHLYWMNNGGYTIVEAGSDGALTENIINNNLGGH